MGLACQGKAGRGGRMTENGYRHALIFPKGYWKGINQREFDKLEESLRPTLHPLLWLISKSLAINDSLCLVGFFCLQPCRWKHNLPLQVKVWVLQILQKQTYRSLGSSCSATAVEHCTRTQVQPASHNPCSRVCIPCPPSFSTAGTQRGLRT